MQEHLGGVGLGEEPRSVKQSAGRSLSILEWLIAAVLVVTCCLMAICNPAIQRTAFAADQLTVPGFIEDLFRNALFSPLTWNIPQAPYAFPDALLFLVLRVIVGDPFVAIIFHTALYIVAIALAAKLIINRSVGDRSRSMSAFVAFLALAVIALGLSTILKDGEMLIWPFVPIAHGSAALTALVVYCAYASFFESRRIVTHLLLTAICTTATFSDRFFVIFFSMPYATTLLLTPSLTRAGIRKTLLEITLFATETLVAYVLAAWLASNFAQQTSSVGFKMIDRFRAVGTLMTSDGFLPWVIWSVGIFAALLLYGNAALPKAAKHQSLEQRRTRIFVGALALFGLAIAFFLWIEPGIALARYSVGLQLGGLLSMAIVLSDCLPTRKSVRWLSIIGLCAAVAIMASAARFLPPTAPLVQKQYISQAMAECQSRFNLKNGLGAYWQARLISAATDWKMHLLQFEANKPRLVFWGSNYLWFFYELETGHSVEANFIVANALNKEDIRRLYGEPAQEAECGPFRILVYPDSARLAEQARALSIIPAWAFAIAGHLPSDLPGISLTGGVDIDPIALSGETGRISPGRAAANESTDQAGHLLFGPSLILPAGSYVLDVVVTCSGDRAANTLSVTADIGKIMIASTKLQSNEVCNGVERSVALPFRLDRRNTGVDFGVRFGGAGALTVSKLTLKTDSIRQGAKADQ